MKEDTFFWVEDTDEQFSLPIKRKRRNRAHELEFIGWGSRPLIEFLDSIGQAADKQLTQHEVTSIINHYVNANNLLNPQKKKMVLCDDKLRALFRKKSVSRIKIYDLLEAHFAENRDESEDEPYSSEEEDGVMVSSYKEKKAKTLGRKTSHEAGNVDEAPKSCFAAVNPENIKLVYLKRSVVEELLKIPDVFEEKLKGSFVRVKSDPNDYLQKHPYHLEQVTGIRKIYGADTDGIDTHLRVSNSVADIHLRMLSDDNFSEEECEDLRERIKAGLIERPTVVALEAKAKILHEDIMKNWIVREIASLQRLIDRANEKGWRRDLYEHMERKKLLQTDSEQKRLLLEIPKVIADELEPQPTSMDPSIRNSDELEPQPTLMDTSIRNTDELEPRPTPMDTSIRAEENDRSPDLTLRGSSNTSIADAAGILDLQEAPIEVEEIENLPARHDKELHEVIIYENTREERQDGSSGERENSQGLSERPVIPAEVIELSDDEDEYEKPETRIQNAHHDLHYPEWHYLDPQGEIQGPFSILALKRWNDSNYFSPGFMVWMTGQSQEQAALLVDVLRQIFPAD